jgi:hypothetical protein
VGISAEMLAKSGMSGNGCGRLHQILNRQGSR